MLNVPQHLFKLLVSYLLVHLLSLGNHLYLNVILYEDMCNCGFRSHTKSYEIGSQKAEQSYLYRETNLAQRPVN